MKLDGKVIGVQEDERVIKVTIEVRRIYEPRSPDATEVRDDKHLEEMMNSFNEKHLEFSRQKKAIENLGMRKATISFDEAKDAI